MPILFTNVRPLPANDPGSGGLPFHCQHPGTGFALVGLTVRAGHWIDQVTPIFAELLDDGTIGPELTGPSFGGFGGGTQELRAAPGWLVSGIQTRSGHFVDALRLRLARWDGASLDPSDGRWTPWVGGAFGGVERADRLIETPAVAIGIAGRAGAFVDNLTLIGGEPVRVAATALSRSVTGRGSRASASV
jgi:hypothetical protein